MLTKVEGIILKTQEYGETHKIVTIYTKQYGKLSAIGRGANKVKSRLSSVTQPFIKGDFLIYIGKGLSTVRQGEIIQSFRHIREDIIKTAYTAYITELTDKLTDANQPDKTIYNQLSHTLTWINDKKKFIIPIIMYEFKLFNKGGFAPIVDRCVNCYNKNDLHSFSIKEGRLLCKQCNNIDPFSFIIGPNIIRLLPIFLNVGIEQIGTISVKQHNESLLRTIMDQYYDTYGGFLLKSKKFLSQIRLLE